MIIETMPNLTGLTNWQTQIVELPQMCPVSGNPQPGSYIAIRYQPQDRFLEVYALRAYLQNYIGGWLRDGALVRDMEQTIDLIARDCAESLGVPVRVRARLILDCGVMLRTAVAE
jgi:hypothetical protein